MKGSRQSKWSFSESVLLAYESVKAALETRFTGTVRIITFDLRHGKKNRKDEPNSERFVFTGRFVFGRNPRQLSQEFGGEVFLVPMPDSLGWFPRQLELSSGYITVLGECHVFNLYKGEMSIERHLG